MQRAALAVAPWVVDLPGCQGKVGLYGIEKSRESVRQGRLGLEKSRVSGGILNSPGCRPKGKAGVSDKKERSRV